MKNLMVEAVVLLVVFGMGYIYSKGCTADANNLVRAGYTIKDPEGYDCKDFDDHFDWREVMN